MKKCWAVAAIFSFIGIAFTPCLTSTVVKESPKTPSVDVTVQVCGLKGFHPYSVPLPQPQYEQLISYLDELINDLKETTTPEKAALIFNAAIEEINTYGLLPKGMSVPGTQLLVNGFHKPSKIASQFENILMNKWWNKQLAYANPSLKNAFCGLYAIATKITGYPNPVIIPFGLLLAIGLFPAFLASLFGQGDLATKLAEIGLGLWMLNPLRWFNFVVFEGYDIAVGSVGLKGLTFNRLSTSAVFTGFTGLMLTGFTNKTYFLGFAFSIYGSS